MSENNLLQLCKVLPRLELRLLEDVMVVGEFGDFRQQALELHARIRIFVSC